MNETGSYPGQPWLWLYQMWYHVHGWSNSDNIDLIAIYMTGLATLLLLLIPFIPGLRDIPRWIPVHRLIWRNWNQEAVGRAAEGSRRRTQARTRRAEVTKETASCGDRTGPGVIRKIPDYTRAFAGQGADDVIHEIRDYAFTSGSGGANPAASGTGWPVI